MIISVEWSLDEERLIIKAAAATWGQLVRRTREDGGLSQRDLARRAGVSQQSISKLEKGSFSPTDLYKVRLARALEHDVADLFPWTDAARRYTTRTDSQARRSSSTSTS